MADVTILAISATDAPAWVSAGAAVATFLVLVVTAIYAVRQFSEAKELRREQTRPFVVPSIGVEQQFLFMYVIENVGKTPAFDVSVAFDPAPESDLNDLENAWILTQPIPTMPPGQRFRTYWESALTVFSEEKPYGHPLSYQAFVTYQDSAGRKYGPERYVLDFQVFRGQAGGTKGLPELVKAVEELTKEHRKWTNGIRGLSVGVVDSVKKARRSERPLHLAATRSAVKDKGIWAACKYWIDVWRNRYGLWIR